MTLKRHMKKGGTVARQGEQDVCPGALKGGQMGEGGWGGMEKTLLDATSMWLLRF